MEIPHEDIGTYTAKQPSFLRQNFLVALKNEIYSLRLCRLRALQDVDHNTAFKFLDAFHEPKDPIAEERGLMREETDLVAALADADRKDEGEAEQDEADDNEGYYGDADYDESEANMLNEDDSEAVDDTNGAASSTDEPFKPSSASTDTPNGDRPNLIQPSNQAKEPLAAESDQNGGIEEQKEDTPHKEEGKQSGTQPNGALGSQSTVSSQTMVDSSTDWPGQPVVSRFDAQRRGIINNLMNLFDCRDFTCRMWYRVHRYLNAIHLARTKANVYPRFWDLDNVQKPGEIFGSMLVNTLPGDAFKHIGRYPNQARDVASLYMTTDAKSEKTMLEGIQGIKHLEQLAKSLFEPNYKPEPYKLGLEGLVLRSMFRHFHDYGEVVGLVTFSHLAKLEIALDEVRQLHKTTEGYLDQIKDRRRDSRGVRAKNPDDITLLLKHKGYNSPLREVITIDEPWPEGWQLSDTRLERRIIHGIKGVDVNNPLPAPSNEWVEKPDDTARKPPLSQKNVAW